MLLIRALGRQRQVDLCKFKATLVYKESSRIPRILHNKTLSQKTKTKPTKQQKKNQVPSVSQYYEGKCWSCWGSLKVEVCTTHSYTQFQCGSTNKCKRKSLHRSGVGELSVFCQSYFNKTLIGQTESIGRKTR